MVYDPGMPQSRNAVRQSVTLPSGVARRVQALAKRERTSASKVIVELIETGLEAREREKKRFFELADRLADSSDKSERKRLKTELARMTYGE
jgi:metal-responsive CopG/Arc/MetJ family transcriptional regulator